MADAWTVPINTAGFNDLNDTIAKGHDLSWIGNLPDAFWKGQDQQYTQNQRNLFKDGIPGDLATTIQQYAKVKGADALPQILNLAKLQYGQDANQNAFPQDSSAPITGQLPPSASRPGGTVQPQQQSQGQPQSDADIPTARPSPPGQNLGQVTGVDRGQVETAGPAGFQTSPQIQPRPVQTVQYTPQNPQGAPTPQTAQQQPQPSGDPTLGGLVPQSFVQRFGPNAAGTYVNLLSKYVSSGMLEPEQAKNYQSRIDAIQGALTKNAETTQDIKNANASNQSSPLAYEGQKKAQDLQIEQGQKTYAGIQAQSSQFDRDLKPYIDLSKSILSDPSMYSGVGGKYALDINRVRAAFGDQKAAMLQEALQKVTASSVLSQINTQKDQMQEAGANSSRIFSQQVDLVTKAAPSMSTTLGGNRFLVEVSDRMGAAANKVAEMARAYKSSHPLGLDTGFDQQVSTYLQSHPVFTTQERSHPEILGAPTVPPDIAGNKPAIIQWGKALGVQPGQAIRFPSGQVKGFDDRVSAQ